MFETKEIAEGNEEYKREDKKGLNKKIKTFE